ncbi:MAG: hypothetical protein ABIP89_00490 [Polyangiaceae bacterium]
MRFRVAAACGSAILGATLLLACFPDYFFFDPEPADGGRESGAPDAGLDAHTAADARDAADALEALDALDAAEEADAPDPLDAADDSDG